MKPRGRIALLLAMLVVLAACGSPEPNLEAPTAAPEPEATSTSGDQEATAFEEIEELARQEGELILYTASHDGINEAEFAAFNELYPEIEVVHTRLVSGEITARFASETEAGAPSADLIKMADNIMFEDHPEWFTPLTTENVPNLANLDSKYVHGHYSNVVAAPFLITWNTNLMDAGPETWEDLVAPEFAGTGGMFLDPRTAGSMMAIFATLGDLLGDEYLEAVGEGYDFYDSAATATQQAAAGELPFVGPGVASHSIQLRADGAPLEINVLTPTIALIHSMAVASNARNPNAALVYLNFLLSRDGQEASCGGENAALAADDLPDCPAAGDDLQILDTLYGQTQSDRVVRLLGLE